ncbi:MAG TPA: DUF1456 domain-containing protein, partial [Spirochaetaceae bacterium]|nr:DUF1456 domain-containing protein [Spirochaetaceae bacterium]
KLRFAIKLNDAAMLELLAAGGAPAERAQLDAWFLADDAPGYVDCPRRALAALLDGLILRERGPRPATDAASPGGSAGKGAGAPEPFLDNNQILKKLRIALQLQEGDMIAIMRRAGVELSKSELSALFRKKGQKNYQECLDQFLRNFLAGLAGYQRADTANRS